MASVRVSQFAVHRHHGHYHIRRRTSHGFRHRTGASGYLIKDGEADYIAGSIRQLLAGGSPISASIARHLLKRFHPPAREAQSDVPKLTAREREVLEPVEKGFSRRK